MKVLLWLVGLFALAVGLSLFAQINTGYAILVLPPWRIELSLNMAVLLLLVAIVLAYLLLRGVALTLRLPDEVKRFQQGKKLKAARYALREGSLAYFSGRFQKAEREALRAIDDETVPENQALAWLIAARSAHAIKDFPRRDGYFERMSSLPDSVQLARHMQQAELLFAENRLSDALAAVTAARAISSNLTAALKLELKIRLLQKVPDGVLQLTDKLYKSEAISASQAEHYRRAALLMQLPTFVTLRELRSWWQKVPASERDHAELRLPVAQRYADLGDPDAAALFLADGMDGAWSAELVAELAALAPSVSESVRLDLVKRGEGWLAAHRHDERLLLMLGRLALAQQLWGKAQNYFEASISVAPTLAAHAELARLFESLNRLDEADHHYTECVQLALESVH